jgi:hypothetical protein
LREGQYLDAYCKFTKMGKPTDAAQVFANILEFQGTDCELH